MSKLNKYLKEIQIDDLSLNIQKSLIDNIKMSPYIGMDELVQNIVKLGFSELSIQDNILKLLTELIKGVGKHHDIPDTDFNPKEMIMGIEVEKEHTDNPLLAKEIAKDHLAECPTYYTRLKKMESQCEN